MSHKLYASTGDRVKRALEHRPSNNEEGEEYGASSFGEFGEYMRRKKLKLQNQDEQIRKEIKDEPPVFKGMVIHINGYTKPPREDLHHLIVKHGGIYKQAPLSYYHYLEGKTGVTHIIASNLTPKKRVEFERYKVVRPEWIVDCVKAGKALPWNRYRLLDWNNQKTLDASKKPLEGYRAVSSREETVVYGGGGLNEMKESSSYPTPPEMKSLELEEGGDEVQLVPAEEAVPMELDESPSSVKMDKEPNQQTSPVAVDMPSTLSPITISSPSAEKSTEHLEKPVQTIAEDTVAVSTAHNAALLANPALRQHTTINPDFIKSYFGSSRLHHLSTWKADLKNQMQHLTSQKPTKVHVKPVGQRWIMHVDFDCFFCSVSLVSRPELKDKPVCVGHGGAKSGEIASCNYPARKFGIHNGMSMGSALERCKDLVCLPYDFPAYEKASRDFYEILLSVNADATQAVSVDEALLDVSSLSNDSPLEDLGISIRDRVREKTQCEVSIGIGPNILLAKLALRKAKPAGQYLLKSEDCQEYMEDIDVQDLPGVGWKLSEKLEETMNIRTVGQLRVKSLHELKEKFGPKTGEKLYNFARGVDSTEVGEIVERKSVSVEVNWGVRFETAEQVDKFLLSLAEELSSRLMKESFIGSHLMLKVMRRAADAPLDPPKHLGHGHCDTFNKSLQLGVPTNDSEVLGKETIVMLRSFNVPPAELRGIGLQMGKLSKVGELKMEAGQKRLDFSRAMQKPENLPPSPKPSAVASPKLEPETGPSAQPLSLKTPIKHTQFLAPTQIDSGVLENLPEDIKSRLVSRKRVAEVPPNQIDQDVFNELPPSIQEELRQGYKPTPKIKLTPKKKPSPKKVKSISLIPGQSKLPVASPNDLDASVLAELPSSLREEVISDARRERALAKASEARRQAWAAEKAVWDRKVSRTITLPDPPPVPTFQKLSKLEDLRNLISMWFEEFRDEGPAEEDVELLGSYLRKVVLIEKDLRKAEAVVRWFLYCCKDVGPAMDEWWCAGQRLGDYVNEACQERGMQRIDF